jgi:hypothetical protein
VICVLVGAVGAPSQNSSATSSTSTNILSTQPVRSQSQFKKRFPTRIGAAAMLGGAETVVVRAFGCYPPSDFGFLAVIIKNRALDLQGHGLYTATNAGATATSFLDILEHRYAHPLEHVIRQRVR